MSYKIWKKSPTKTLSQKEVEETLASVPPSKNIYTKQESDRIDRELSAMIRRFQRLLKSAEASMPSKEDQIEYLTIRVLDKYAKDRFGMSSAINGLFKIDASGAEVSVYSFALYDWKVPEKFYLRNGDKFDLYRIDLTSKTVTVETFTQKAPYSASYEYEFELTFPVQKMTFKVTEWAQVPFDISNSENNKELFKVALAVDILESNRGTQPLGMVLFEEVQMSNGLSNRYWKYKKFLMDSWKEFEKGLKNG